MIAFIFADLIIMPILNIYRRYYGRRVAAYLFVVSLSHHGVRGPRCRAVVHVTGLTPTDRNITVFDTSVTWNYNTFLNIVFLLLMAAMLVRFLRTGGIEMLRMMKMPGKHHA